MWALNGYFSIFRWTNFYISESLRVWVLDPKPVYQFQNSSGYSTGAPIAVDCYHFGSGYDPVLIMIGGVYNCVTCYCVIAPISHSSDGNLVDHPLSWSLCRRCDIVTFHTVTVIVGKNTQVKTWYLVLKSWLCNKNEAFLDTFSNKFGMYECSLRFQEQSKNKIRLLT